MECMKPTPKAKLTLGLSRCLHPPPTRKPSSKSQSQSQSQSRAAKEALLAKLFASVSSIKASYAELQSAQSPYDSLAVQTADKNLVSELVVLSDLKHKLLTRSLNLPPPHLANLLAEIQEQQSNIKTYQISIKQLESKSRHLDSQIASLKSRLDVLSHTNRAIDRRLNSSCLIAPALSISDLNASHFIRSLQQLMRSVRSFVKQLVRQMESKNWDLDLAANAIEKSVDFPHPKHMAYAFESYVYRIMFDGFNHPDFLLPTPTHHSQKEAFFHQFRQLHNPHTHLLIHNPHTHFATFVRSKYLKLVQPKMECSFFGNLDQRKLISSAAFPETDFFSAFAEMARGVWLLHCLAFSYDPPAVAFQVKKGCRFSEVYMESVAPGAGAGLLAAFTVVPGFKIGKTVVQSQVYLVSPAASRPTKRR